jgi:REP element-mobilizing transposase RayT
MKSPAAVNGKPVADRRSGTTKPVADRRSRSSVVPYNPQLHNLVEGKQKWAVPLPESTKAKGFLGWHQRGYLPHHDLPWVTQFVTMRLADSLPTSRRHEWEHLLKIEDDRERRRQLEEYLDRGRGECWLGQARVAKLAEGALLHFNNQRYELKAWVVMPNHMHVLVDIWETPLSDIAKSWKSHIAREGNRLMGRSGEMWQREYLDTVIKTDERRRVAIRYIENNPVKAGLVRCAAEWGWSSAKFRGKDGRLVCSEDVSRSQTGAPEPQSRSQTGAPAAGDCGAPVCDRLTAPDSKSRPSV